MVELSPGWAILQQLQHHPSGYHAVDRACSEVLDVVCRAKATF